MKDGKIYNIHDYLLDGKLISRELIAVIDMKVPDSDSDSTDNTDPGGACRNIKPRMWANYDKLTDKTIWNYFKHDKIIKKTVVYIHNGSKFDLVFLLKELLKDDLYKVYPVYRDGSFLSLPQTPEGLAGASESS